MLLVEIMLNCSHHYLGVVSANTFELATKHFQMRFILTLSVAGAVYHGVPNPCKSSALMLVTVVRLWQDCGKVVARL